GACSCVDPHPKSRVRWKGITAIKPNLTETFRILNLHEDDLPDASEIPIQVKDLGQALHRVWDCDFVLITLGNQGMALISREGDFHHQQVRAREIFDVSGAGDTAIALFALGLCSGATAREATEISSLASSLVVGKVGTSAVSAQE